MQGLVDSYERTKDIKKFGVAESSVYRLARIDLGTLIANAILYKLKRDNRLFAWPSFLPMVRWKNFVSDFEFQRHDRIYVVKNER